MVCGRRAGAGASPSLSTAKLTSPELSLAEADSLWSSARRAAPSSAPSSALSAAEPRPQGRPKQAKGA